MFDKVVFPFESLHENVGARLQHEILLLPDHLRNTNQGGGIAMSQYLLMIMTLIPLPVM